LPEDFDIDEKLDNDIPAPAVPDSLLDSWMLTHFPGRFLDEMHAEMDIFRFLRAIQARNIESIENTRRQYFDRKLKQDDITAEQWEEIRHHDKLMAYLLKGK
jgi:hypothetical protein